MIFALPLACGPTLDGVFDLLALQVLKMVAVAAVFAFSGMGLMRLVDRRLQRNRRIREVRSLCPRCQFDLRAAPSRGLPLVSVCPECGLTIRYGIAGASHSTKK